VDLAPFAGINPCGFPGLAVTSLAMLGVATNPDEVGAALASIVLAKLGLSAGSNQTG
jgi:lipoyl(octanoyl) transferase